MIIAAIRVVAARFYQTAQFKSCEGSKQRATASRNRQLLANCVERFQLLFEFDCFFFKYEDSRHAQLPIDVVFREESDFQVKNKQF